MGGPDGLGQRPGKVAICMKGKLLLYGPCTDAPPLRHFYACGCIHPKVDGTPRHANIANDAPPKAQTELADWLMPHTQYGDEFSNENNGST